MSTDTLRGLLARLYAEQAALAPADDYLREHGSPAAIDAQVRTFQWYRPFLPAAGAVLDWGCNHAPDSVLLRAEFGDRFDLFGCDVADPGRFPPFHAAARFAYAKLDHPVRLPYPDGLFTAVVASGALEHVAQDYESLKELYRVMGHHAVLIISYLPNRRSVKEWYLRAVRRRHFHRRLYTLKEARDLLLHTGFEPLVAEPHTFTADRVADALGLPSAARALGRHVPFASTLRLVARKVESF